MEGLDIADQEPKLPWGTSEVLPNFFRNVRECHAMHFGHIRSKLEPSPNSSKIHLPPPLITQIYVLFCFYKTLRKFNLCCPHTIRYVATPRSGVHLPVAIRGNWLSPSFQQLSTTHRSSGRGWNSMLELVQVWYMLSRPLWVYVCNCSVVSGKRCFSPCSYPSGSYTV